MIDEIHTELQFFPRFTQNQQDIWKWYFSEQVILELI